MTRLFCGLGNRLVKKEVAAEEGADGREEDELWGNLWYFLWSMYFSSYIFADPVACNPSNWGFNPQKETSLKKKMGKIDNPVWW